MSIDKVRENISNFGMRNSLKGRVTTSQVEASFKEQNFILLNHFHRVRFGEIVHDYTFIDPHGLKHFVVPDYSRPRISSRFMAYDILKDDMNRQRSNPEDPNSPIVAFKSSSPILVGRINIVD